LANSERRFCEKMKRILFVINPISGIGRQKIVENIAENVLDKTKSHFDFVYTKYPRHAKEIAKNNSSRYDIIIAVGGDGTINEIASGLVGSQCILAIIPTGSGNGLARCLGIPMNIKKAIALIENGKTKEIDTLFCNDMFFVNVGGVGFDAEVGHQFENAKNRGFFSYLKITVLELLNFQSQKIEFDFDGQIRQTEALLISFANSNQWGNNVKIAPFAKVDDGLVDVCVLKKFPLIIAPIIGVRLLLGTITKSRYFESFSTKQITITKQDIVVKFHLDGEPMIAQGNSLHIKVIPKSLSVIVPN